MAGTGIEAAAAAEGLANASRTPAAKRLEGLRVLLVEDNLINQQVACELLEVEGAQVRVAGDGQQALQALAAEPQGWDVVLMDLQMPVMDGLSAARAIRLQPALQTLPIVAMTANALESDRQAALAAGMNDHVGKPFDLDTLVQALRQQMGGSAGDPGEAAVRAEGSGAAPALPAALEEQLRRLEAATAVPPALAMAATDADVDIASALGRMHGRIDIYHRMLHRVTHSLAGLAEEWRQRAAEGDGPTLMRGLHALRAAAPAMLGARALATALADLERQAERRRQPEGHGRCGGPAP